MVDPQTDTTEAILVDVRGIVQGVGFRPFVARLADRHRLRGRVRNSENGVEIEVEGGARDIQQFLSDLKERPPTFARISSCACSPRTNIGFADFRIEASTRGVSPTAAVSPDLPVCDECIEELFRPTEARFHYPYINCSNCGPRYSIVRSLPYDRASTTMSAWPMCDRCSGQYEDSNDRRYHAQPLSCPTCGPTYWLRSADPELGSQGGRDAVCSAAEMLSAGAIVAVKGVGGYHLACSAFDENAVSTLRERKFRKEKPFAVMARDLSTVKCLAELDEEAERLLTSAARPIVLARSRVEMTGIAPGSDEIGVMLPYAPLHYLLFAEGAPDVLVMTSANRSSEPIAFEDEDARKRLGGLADAFMVGERPIARRVDDSVVRCTVFGPAIIRRSRGYAPESVADIPSNRPILAVGADLKNAVTLVIGGRAFISQHIGDLHHLDARRALEETVEDLLEMYEVPRNDLLVVHDAHPEYASTQLARELSGACIEVQHHRAHVASVLAERSAFDRKVVAVALDGTGYGDDGTVWGGEIFVGSLRGGMHRRHHLREALLPGGDAAAGHPVQAAAGFLIALENLPELEGEPFNFPQRYRQALSLVDGRIRTFRTTSAGRLFDTVAALLGFMRPITFEGQAAIWLEQLARRSRSEIMYPFPDLDYVPLLREVVRDRAAGRDPADIARAFHAGFAEGLVEVLRRIGEEEDCRTVVLSGGVLQNQVLLGAIARSTRGLFEIWTNQRVPANDGGISLGQAAMAAMIE